MTTLHRTVLWRPLAYCLFALCATPTTLWAVPEAAQEKKVAAAQPKEKKAPENTLAHAVWKVSKERGEAFLGQVNPISFAISFAFTFPIMHFLIDEVLRKALNNQQIGFQLPQFNDLNLDTLWNNSKVFVFEGVLFYVLHVLSALLNNGVLEPLLVPFESFHKLYRFLAIALSTAFMGTCLLLPTWWHGLLGLLTVTVLLSLFTCPKEKRKSAYLITNVMVVLLTWGMIKGAWYLVVRTDKLDHYLELSGLIPRHNAQQNGNQGNRKAAPFKNLMMSHGNLGIFKIWDALKDHLFVGVPNVQGGNAQGYVLLHRVLTENQNNFFFKHVMDFIRAIPAPGSEICEYIFKNVLFDLAKDLLL